MREERRATLAQKEAAPVHLHQRFARGNITGADVVIDGGLIKTL